MSFIRRLYRSEHHFDFPAMWRRGLTVSAVLVVISIGSLAFRGLNLGIEFEGGTASVSYTHLTLPTNREV